MMQQYKIAVINMFFAIISIPYLWFFLYNSVYKPCNFKRLQKT
jgi:hypothetical protein